MHLNEYPVGSIVQLTQDVCEKRVGELGEVVKQGDNKVIRFQDETYLITRHVKKSSPYAEITLDELEKRIDLDELFGDIWAAVEYCKDKNQYKQKILELINGFVTESGTTLGK